MRWAWIACLLLASLLPVSAEDWTTEDGHVYHNVTVLGQEDDGVRITYDGGVGKVPYYELPVDIQKRFGQDVDSLAIKRQAVDKAIADAVHSAATADVMLPAAPVVVPSQVPSIAPSVPSPENPTPGVAPAPGVAPTPGGGTATTAPGTTAPGTTAPGPTAPGATAPGTSAPTGPNVTPGNPNPAPGTAATTTKPGQAPGATATTAPGAHNPSANPAHPGVAATPAPAVDLSGLNEQAPHTSAPTGVAGAGGKPLDLAVSSYTYNNSLDVCYLDSPPIDAYTANSKTAPGQGSSLTLRIVTDGRTPQIPDRYEMTFVAVGGAGGDLSLSDIHFTTDTGEITVADSDRKDSGSLPGGAQAMRYVSFYLSADDVKRFSSAKTQTFSVGRDIYHLDARGAQILHDYMSDVGTLQPASSSLMRSFYKMLMHIPSFFSILSTICEYAILGSFGLILAFSIAAFILGISRFIKM